MLPQRPKAPTQRHPAPNDAGLLCRPLLAPPRQTRRHATLGARVAARPLAPGRPPPRADAGRAVDLVNPQRRRSDAEGTRRVQEPGHQDVLLLFRQHSVPRVCGAGADEARSPTRTAAVVAAAVAAILVVVGVQARPERGVPGRRALGEAVVSAVPGVQPPDERVRGAVDARRWLCGMCKSVLVCVCVFLIFLISSWRKGQLQAVRSRCQFDAR